MARYTEILQEIEGTLSQVSKEATEALETTLTEAATVFTAAKGRSGLVAQGFAMRLNQLGQRAFVVGETVTPAIQKGDVLLIISGSGTTAHLKLLAEKAQEIGAHIVLITTREDSPIAAMAAQVVVLPGGTKYDEAGSHQPLGSLFEQSSQIFLDSIVLDIMEKQNVDETTMQNNHANLE